jgi:hypothetical protein
VSNQSGLQVVELGVQALHIIAEASAPTWPGRTDTLGWPRETNPVDISGDTLHTVLE